MCSHPLASAATGFTCGNVFTRLHASVCTYLHLASSVRCRGRNKCWVCCRIREVFHICQQTQPRNRMTWEGSLQTDQLKSHCLTTYKFCFFYSSLSLTASSLCELQLGLPRQQLQVWLLPPVRWWQLLWISSFMTPKLLF